jgi:hypothetical protein
MEDVVIFMVIWSILLQFGIFCGYVFSIFSQFWYVVRGKKSGSPVYNASDFSFWFQLPFLFDPIRAIDSMQMLPRIARWHIYFHTKNPNLGIYILDILGMEKCWYILLFCCGDLVYLMDIWYIL